MVCKKCGFDIEKRWKYCPNCSKRIYRVYEIIFFCLLAFLIIYFGGAILIAVIEKNTEVDIKYVEKHLERKYFENIENVVLVKSEKMPDEVLDCDGSTFWINEGGMTEYYKAYSKKNDIEFLVTYDTSDESKTLEDNYKETLKQRKVFMEAYEIMKNYFKNDNVKIVLYGSDNTINITSKSQLKKTLSRFEERNNNLFDFGININEDLLEFSKENYEEITKLNNELVKLKEKNDYYFETYIYLNNDAEIELYQSDNKAYVYNEFFEWETLDKYVRRKKLIRG